MLDIMKGMLSEKFHCGETGEAKLRRYLVGNVQFNGGMVK
jgi:hypothetical protein